MMEVAVIDQLNEDSLRSKFEELASDSYGFKRSAKGTYVNGSTARDWKWFKLGLAAAPERSGKAADDGDQKLVLSNDINNVPGNTNKATTEHLWALGYRKAPAGNSSAAPSDDPQKNAADFLLTAAQDFWDSCKLVGQYGAVQWIIGSDGQMLIYTRGEYKDQLMRNIHEFPQEVRHFATPAPTGESLSVPEGPLVGCGDGQTREMRFPNKGEYARETVNNWMGEHDVVLRNEAYNALLSLFRAAAKESA